MLVLDAPSITILVLLCRKAMGGSKSFIKLQPCLRAALALPWVRFSGVHTNCVKHDLGLTISQCIVETQSRIPPTTEPLIV